MAASNFRACAVRCVVAVVALLGAMAQAEAARVGVLSNRYSFETASDFNTRISSHVFTAVDTSSTVPSLQQLTEKFDVVLLFEDQTYANAPAVGDVIAAYAKTGRAVVIGAFYDQDRSDAPAVTSPHGWGALEALDPNTTDGVGTPGAARTLNIDSMQRHTLTRGITALSSALFAGGNEAKKGTTVLAWWKEPNARGQPDPAIAYRLTGPACIIHIAIAPNYPSIGSAGIDYKGDFHRAWKNGFDFAGAGCVGAAIDGADGDVNAIPALSTWGLILTMLLVAAAAWRPAGRRVGRRAGRR